MGSNNGSLVRILKSLVNLGCVVKRGTTKILIVDSNSILIITYGIEDNGGNAKNVPTAIKMKKHHDHKLQPLDYKNKNAYLLHLFVIQRDQ